jgi:hypothetical protein
MRKTMYDSLALGDWVMRVFCASGGVVVVEKCLFPIVVWQSEVVMQIQHFCYALLGTFTRSIHGMS